MRGLRRIRHTTVVQLAFCVALSHATAGSTSAFRASSAFGTDESPPLGPGAHSWTLLDNLRLESVAYSANETGNYLGPTTQFVYSPDGRLVAYVIQRVDADRDYVESDLRVQSIAEIQEFAKGGGVPRTLFELKTYSTKNASALRDLSWSRTATRLYFTALSRDVYRLMQWIPGRRTATAITRPTLSVAGYQEVDDSTLLLYLPDKAIVSRDAAAPFTATGLDLWHAVDPTYGNHVEDRFWSLDSKRLFLLDSRTGVLIRTNLFAFPFLGASVSPNGRFIAFLEPVSAHWRGTCWEAEPANRHAPNDLAAQLVIYDRRTTRISRPLGPSSYHLSPNADSSYTPVAWSPDSSRVIVPDAFAGKGCPEDGRPTLGVYVVGPEIEPRLLAHLAIGADGVMPEYVSDKGWDAAGNPWITLRQEPSPAAFFAQKVQSGLDGPTMQVFAQDSDGQYHKIAERSAEPASAAKGADVLGVCEDTNVLPRICAHSGGATRTLYDLGARVRSAHLEEFKSISWIDGNKTSWRGWLAIPNSGKAPYPLIIQTHGDALRSHQFLAEGATPNGYPGRAGLAAGFAILHAIEPKDSGPRIGEPGRRLAGYEAIVDKLAAEHLIDKSKVGIIGWSRSAGYVEYAVTHDPTFARAAVIADGLDYGLWQYLVYQELSDGLTQQYTPLYGGDIASHPDVWLSEAPDLLGARLNTPVRIQAHGFGSIFSEWGFYATARRHDVPVTLDYYADIHNLFRAQDRKHSLTESLDWFRFWLQDYEDPSPAKAAKYAQWRHMKEVWSARQALASQLDQPPRASGNEVR